MIERNPITGEAVIIAPERGERPNLYRNIGEACPFCPGNEALTPPEILRIGEPWRIRLFPNKYPATERHEVIVEASEHDASFARIAHARDVVQLYVERYHALSSTAAHVTIFKNEGLMAGASIPHLHSQVVATPFVPPRVEREIAGFASRCPLCSLTDASLIEETPHYRWIAPRGSLFAYETWIVPKRHAPAIEEPHELSDIMQRSVRTMEKIAESFNWIFMNFPLQSPAHWYLQLFPRLGVHAGFELGSASGINTVDPAAAARIYRQYCE